VSARKAQRAADRSVRSQRKLDRKTADIEIGYKGVNGQTQAVPTYIAYNGQRNTTTSGAYSAAAATFKINADQIAAANQYCILNNILAGPNTYNRIGRSIKMQGLKLDVTLTFVQNAASLTSWGKWDAASSNTALGGRSHTGPVHFAIVYETTAADRANPPSPYDIWGAVDPLGRRTHPQYRMPGVNNETYQLREDPTKKFKVLLHKQFKEFETSYAPTNAHAPSYQDAVPAGPTVALYNVNQLAPVCTPVKHSVRIRKYLKLNHNAVFSTVGGGVDGDQQTVVEGRLWAFYWSDCGNLLGSVGVGDYQANSTGGYGSAGDELSGFGTPILITGGARLHYIDA